MVSPGCITSRAFYAMLEDELHRSNRHNHPLSLLMLDVDHFKLVNDTYGHRAGDTILRGLSNLLMEQLRDIDRVCRYGGEEIIVIMPETMIEDAIEVAERLRKAIEAESFGIGENKKIHITASLGVASYPLHAQAADELVTVADAALYYSKASGGATAYRWR